MRIGVDIGGTFTDIVATDDAGAVVYVAKLPARSAATSMLDGIAAALRDTGSHPDRVDLVVHATTLGTNALLQLQGARVALVTTAGFRDVLELARARRPSLYDLQFDKFEPLVPRDRRFEVRERVDHHGEVVVPLDEASARELIPALHSLEPESIAVCLLHAYANPAHERRVGELLRAALPGVPVICSHEVLPEPKEFERTTTTVVCAYLAPLLQTYLDEVTAGLAERGLRAPLYVMHSAGGVLRPVDVQSHAHTLVESGPAAGVLAATQLIRTELPPERRSESFVSFDMGGTTAKACLIRNGEFTITTDYEVGRGAHESFSVKLSGYPIKSPVIDLIESGQGGGSIAWIDSAGVLKVGPRSAGAVPGPACYGRGGDLPTVTDCNLVLGRLSPERFAGGTMALYPDRARTAIETHLARRLGVGVEEAAAGVLRVVNAAMARSIRVISVQRGVDPRSLTLITFGGAGPLHAAELAAELGIPRVFVPPQPGVFSAAGLVFSDLRLDFSQASGLVCRPENDAALAATFGALADRAHDWLAQAGHRAAEANLALHADVRYVGQTHTITVDVGVLGLESRVLGDGTRVLGAGSWVLGDGTRVLGAGSWVLGDGEDVIPNTQDPAPNTHPGVAPNTQHPAPSTRAGLGERVRAAFDDTHERLFSFANRQSAAEVVTCRATCSVSLAPDAAIGSGRLFAPAADGAEARVAAASRPVFFAGHGFVDTRIVSRASLPEGAELAGPAIVEEPTSAVVLPPGSRCVAGAGGILEIDL